MPQSGHRSQAVPASTSSLSRALLQVGMTAMFKLAWPRKRAPTGKNGRKRESSQLTDSKYLSSSRAPAKGLCPTKNAAGGAFPRPPL